jgi:O-methyltransferase
MSTSFGFLSRLEFLQTWASLLVSKLNPAIAHNIEKYHAIKKVHYLSSIEDIEGDYLEFGVFTGSSFSHSMRCCRSLARTNPGYSKIRFFGFDSFQGFGELNDRDAHPFYRDNNFETDIGKVTKRCMKAAGNLKFRLVPGFFSDSLKDGPDSLGIEKARIIFLDSDTFSSADEALRFCEPIVQVGTYLILDDYFSYRGREDMGVAAAYLDFENRTGANSRQLCSYGMGGVVFVISELIGTPDSEYRPMIET